MTFILFYLLEWAFQYLNKEAIKKKLPLALISLAVFLVGVVIAFPYISTRLGDLGTGRIVIVLSYCRSAGDGRLFFDPY